MKPLYAVEVHDPRSRPRLGLLGELDPVGIHALLPKGPRVNVARRALHECVEEDDLRNQVVLRGRDLELDFVDVPLSPAVGAQERAEEELHESVDIDL